MGTWDEGSTFSTIDIKKFVDEIVERSGWCGGNSMAFLIQNDPDQTIANGNVIRRLAKSFDDDPSSAPVLRISYDGEAFDGNDTGCNLRTYQIPIAQAEHDAHTEQNSSATTTSSSGMPLTEPGKSYEIGLIFELPIEKDTTIVNANLQFSTKGSNASDPGTSNLLINAEASDNAANFNGANNNLSPSSPPTRPHITGTGIPAGGNSLGPRSSGNRCNL